MRSLTWLIVGLLGVFLLFVLVVPALVNNNIFNPSVVGPPQTGEEAETPVVRDLDTLLFPADDQNLAGRQVDIDTASVFSEPNERIAWVGPSEQNRILVVQDQLTDISKGDMVSVAGVVRRLPESDSYPEEWNLSEADRNKLQNQMYYIEASSLTLR